MELEDRKKEAATIFFQVFFQVHSPFVSLCEFFCETTQLSTHAAAVVVLVVVVVVVVLY